MKTILIFMAVILAACNTVAPVPVAAHSTAYDGSFGDAGILNVEKAVNGQQIGLRVTAFYMSTLRARVQKFGSRLTPAVTLDNYLPASVHFMPDVPGRGETWFVPNSVQDIDAKLAQFERDTPK
jgi:hypothetical protein